MGGGVGNPITQPNLQARPGEFVYKHNSQPYVGPYHKHQNGTFMIGAGQMGVSHEIKPNEVIIRKNQYKQGGMTQKNSQWVYYGTSDPYHGHVIQINGDWFTTTSGTIEGNRKQVEPNPNR